MRVEIKRVFRKVVALLDQSEDTTHSAIVDFRDAAVVGLILPALDSGNITFEVAHEDDPTKMVPLKKIDGTAVTVTAGTGGFAVSASELDHLAGYQFARIVCAAQSVDREFIFLIKT